MATGPWRKNGSISLLVGDTGGPFWCDHCPCEPPCLTAIKERQQAFGLVAPNLIDDSGATSYTLAQLKAYVNALCTGASGAFIANGYTGGASTPTWLASTYANSATTIPELCALVLAMHETNRTVASGAYEYWYGIANNADLETAKAAAIADYHFYESGSGLHIVAYTKIEHYGNWYVGMALEPNRLTISGLSTALGKTVNFWSFAAVANPGDPFDAQGKTPVVENEWSNIEIVAAGLAASAISALWPAAGAPPNWGTEESILGFRDVTSSQFGTIVWAFTET